MRRIPPGGWPPALAAIVGLTVTVAVAAWLDLSPRREATIAAAGLALTAALAAYLAALEARARRLARAASASRADAAAARYRGELLHAIATAATELAATERIDEALGRALRAVGEAALVDRVVVLERVEGAERAPPALVTRHAWRSTLAPPAPPGAEPFALPAAADDPEGPLRSLAEGRPHAAIVRALPPPMRERLEALGVRSVLLVPMAVEGRLWGALTLDDCTAEREWTSAEIDILKALSDLVATSIAHARHLHALAAANERIALLARSDPLTGVANRAEFGERLRAAFDAATRNGRGFAVLTLDVDRFKEVNDTFGHPTGDLLVTAVALRLVESTRKTDLVARIGGDEFAVLQTDLVDPSGAGTLAEKIRRALAEPYVLGGKEVRVTASIGVAEWRPALARPEDLLAQADRALYLAKDEGRDRFRFHSDALDREVRLHAALGEELRDALIRDELELHYQPQVELASGRIAGLEALVRWRHPARGLLGPAEFLPVAERSGALLPLCRWVLDRACRQLVAWRRDGLAPPTLVVNVSAAQLRAGSELVATLADTLARWELPPGALELDVTEAMVAEASRSSGGVLERLRDLGVRIAIDDFGARGSTLDVLRAYRVSRLTIPRPLLEGAPRDPGDAAAVRAILALARELGVAVIAKGVETEAQRALVASAPAALGQGFLLGRPVPAGEATELLRASPRAPVEAGAPVRRDAARSASRH